MQASRISSKLLSLLQWIASLHPAGMGLKVCSEIFLWAERVRRWRLCAHPIEQATTRGQVGKKDPCQHGLGRKLSTSPLLVLLRALAALKPLCAVCIHCGLALAPVQALVLVLDLELVTFNTLSWKKGASLQHIINKETLQSSWEQRNKARGWRSVLQGTRLVPDLERSLDHFREQPAWFTQCLLLAPGNLVLDSC